MIIPVYIWHSPLFGIESDLTNSEIDPIFYTLPTFHANVSTLHTMSESGTLDAILQGPIESG